MPRQYFEAFLPLGVTGNTPDSGSGESWFDPRRGNWKRDERLPLVALFVSGRFAPVRLFLCLFRPVHDFAHGVEVGLGVAGQQSLSVTPSPSVGNIPERVVLSLRRPFS